MFKVSFKKNSNFHHTIYVFTIDLSDWLKSLKADKQCFHLFLKEGLFLDLLANTDDEFLENIFKQISPLTVELIKLGLAELRGIFFGFYILHHLSNVFHQKKKKKKMEHLKEVLMINYKKLLHDQEQWR